MSETIEWPLLYVGFNRRVIALSRETGAIIWKWKAPKGSGFPAILVQVPDLYVSVAGYTYCLDASSGQQKWFNPLSGMGMGVPTLAVDGRTSYSGSQAAATAQQQAAAAGAAGAGS